MDKVRGRSRSDFDADEDLRQCLCVHNGSWHGRTSHPWHPAPSCGRQGKSEGSRVHERDLPAGRQVSRFETEILTTRKNLKESP